MSRLRLLVILLLVFVGPSVPPADADSPVRQAILTCDVKANRALLVFDAGPEVLPELPEDIAVPWSGQPPRKDLACTLSDGREIKARLGSEQVHPYGMCGADPAWFFSLWVGGSKVMSRIYFYGGCFAGFLHRAIELSGKRLTACEIAPAQNMKAGEQPVRYSGLRCHNRSDLLQRALPDPVEYPPDGSPARPGALEVSQWSDAAYCAGLIARGDAGETWDGLTYWWSGGDTFRIEASGVPLEKFPYQARLGLGRLYDLDIDGDGATEPLYWERREDGVFDGDYLIVGGRGGPIAALSGENVAAAIKTARDAGLAVIAGDRTPFEDVRLTHFTPVVAPGGGLLLWAWPTALWREPAAILYALGPRGELSTLCSFTRVPENF
jgi:hypothetical protein